MPDTKCFKSLLNYSKQLEMDYNTKIERFQKANEQLRREAGVERILVSDAIKL